MTLEKALEMVFSTTLALESTPLEAIVDYWRRSEDDLESTGGLWRSLEMTLEDFGGDSPYTHAPVYPTVTGRELVW